MHISDIIIIVVIIFKRKMEKFEMKTKTHFPIDSCFSTTKQQECLYNSHFTSWSRWAGSSLFSRMPFKMKPFNYYYIIIQSDFDVDRAFFWITLSLHYAVIFRSGHFHLSFKTSLAYGVWRFSLWKNCERWWNRYRIIFNDNEADLEAKERKKNRCTH